MGRPVSSIKGILSGGVLVAAALCFSGGAGVIAAQNVSAAPCVTTSISGATITVTPCSGLTPGQTVTVTGTGFLASPSGGAVPVGIAMCVSKGTATTLLDCDIIGTLHVTASDASGNIKTTYVVKSPITTKNEGTVVCNSTGNCAVAAQAPASTIQPPPGAGESVGFGPSTSVPEAPLAIALPLFGAGAAASAVFLRRRRRS